MINRRRILQGGAALTLAMTANPAFAQSKTLRMWTFLDPSGSDPREKALKKIIENFQAANPGVTVEVEPQVWSQLTDKFFAAHRAGTGPDVMWVHLSRLPAAVEMKTLLNLNELFINGWSDDERADLDDAAWAYTSTDTERYHIFHSRSYTGVLYRADLFTEKGIKPDDLATWDKFIPAVSDLMQKDGSNVTRWGFGQSFASGQNVPPIAMNIMLEADGKLFDYQGKALWATDGGVSGLTLQSDLIKKHQVSPEAVLSWNVEDTFDQFGAGRMVTMRGSSVRVPRMQGLLGNDKVGFMPAPGLKNGFTPGLIQGWAVGVSSTTKEAELAGKFVEHMSSKESDAIWTLEAGAAPIRKSTITNNPDFFAKPDKKYLAEAGNAMGKHGWLVPEIDVSGWEDDLIRASQEVIAKGTDPKEALSTMEAEFNRRHRR